MNNLAAKIYWNKRLDFIKKLIRLLPSRAKTWSKDDKNKMLKYLRKLKTLYETMEKDVNIYNAYRELKNGQIIKCEINKEVHFCLEAQEKPVGRKRIITCDLQQLSECYDPKTKEITDPFCWEELEKVCLNCFEEDAKYSTITLEQMMEEIAVLHKKNYDYTE